MNRVIPRAILSLALLAPVSAFTEPGGEQALVQQELAALRLATAPYQRFENAVAVGWDLQVTDCVTDPSVGGMG